MALLFKYVGLRPSGALWGVVYITDPTFSSWDWNSDAQCMTFWTNQHFALQTKMCMDDWTLYTNVRSKQKTYQTLCSDEFIARYPEVVHDLEKLALFAMLSIP